MYNKLIKPNTNENSKIHVYPTRREIHCSDCRTYISQKIYNWNVSRQVLRDQRNILLSDSPKTIYMRSIHYCNKWHCPWSVLFFYRRWCRLETDILSINKYKRKSACNSQTGYYIDHNIIHNNIFNGINPMSR